MTANKIEYWINKGWRIIFEDFDYDNTQTWTKMQVLQSPDGSDELKFYDGIIY